MSPTSSSNPFAGRKALSATLRTTSLPSGAVPPSRRGWGGEQYGTARLNGKGQATRADVPPLRCRLAGTGPVAGDSADRVARRDASAHCRRRARPRRRGRRRCGGGQRQDAGAPSGAFAVDVTRASFPARQALARPSILRLAVRNTGARAVPEPGRDRGHRPAACRPGAVGLRHADRRAGLADPRRPVWVLDRGPRGGDTAYVDTWAFGALAPRRHAHRHLRASPPRAPGAGVSPGAWRRRSRATCG